MEVSLPWGLGMKVSLVALLAPIGVKMLLKDVLHAAAGLTYYTLTVIALVLTVGVVASVGRSQRSKSDAGRKWAAARDSDEVVDTTATRNS